MVEFVFDWPDGHLFSVGGFVNVVEGGASVERVEACRRGKEFGELEGEGRERKLGKGNSGSFDQNKIYLIMANRRKKTEKTLNMDKMSLRDCQ